PQCWAQISDKYEERRVLVAESCGLLAPFVDPHLRPSLILSILQQLQQDKSPLVREAMCKNFTILVSYLEDCDKLSQVFELAKKLLFDQNEKVVSFSQQYLFPIIADWTIIFDVFYKKFLNQIVVSIQTIATSVITQQHVNQLE